MVIGRGPKNADEIIFCEGVSRIRIRPAELLFFDEASGHIFPFVWTAAAEDGGEILELFVRFHKVVQFLNGFPVFYFVCR